MPQSYFDPVYHGDIYELLHWRRDVRSFREEPVPEALLDQILTLASTSPSVGLSQPWRFVRVENSTRRKQMIAHFEKCKQQAGINYRDEKAAVYNNLKLSGMKEAPHHIAVYSVTNPEQGYGLGRKTMPETTLYSTVMSVFAFWLAARAFDVGVGWVSILEPDYVNTILAPPDDWTFVAYLCVGYPRQSSDTPELEKLGWEKRHKDCNEWIWR